MIIKKVDVSSCSIESQEARLLNEHVEYKEHTHTKSILGIDMDYIKGALSFITFGANFL